MELRFAAPLRYLLRTTSRNRAPPPLPAGFLLPSGPLRCHLAGQPNVPSFSPTLSGAVHIFPARAEAPLSTSLRFASW